MNLRRYLRNRAVGLARRAATPMRSWRAGRAPARLELRDVRRRLELLLAGMYGRPMRIGTATPASPATAHRFDVELPSALDASDGLEAAAARYRLLAIEQAERLARGAGPRPNDRMERDLYLLAEGAAVDRAITARAPGLAGTIEAVHARELAARPPLERLKGAERQVELLVRALLGEAGRAALDLTEPRQTPDDSLAWAHAEAERIRAGARAGSRYRGVRSVRSWRLGREAYAPNELAPMPGAAIGDIRSASVAAPSTKGAPSPSSDGEGGDSAQEGADSTTAASVPSPSGAAEERDSAGEESANAAAAAREPRAGRPGISYPEWDDYAGRYKPDATTVHDEPSALGDERWAADILDEQAAIVRQVRARFSQLRAQRVRLRAQRSGDELDLDACVSALVDLRLSRVPSDRLYRVTRPARRTLGIVLLVDVSGSTRSKVSDDRTVLDVERMTVLLASEALDALGDPYAVLAFSGAGAHDVQMRTVKRFTGDDRALVHRRIAGLVPMDYTRLGAALRHATAVLNAQPAERRLLLLLSDGKPNDLRGYQGIYAVEDSRQALAEARASGVHPFCLTVDREETEYLPHLFGVSGYRLLREPAQLPGALLRVVEQLLPH